MVVNFAAESHVDRSIENPEIFLDTNIKGTAVMMDACRKYGIKRYHQVSTDEVYGDLPLDRPDLFFTEETPIHTSSPYSSSKAGADLLVLAYHRTYGLPVTISRCSNNYGPYHFPEKLIPLMIANALADKPLPVYGEGLNVRDWLYVEDHCRAIDLIIHNGRVIMAAGIGSRFGGGIKQLAPVGLNGEIIMDYSIHDAIEAGFNKIVFIIRKDIKDAFKEAIGNRIEKICKDLDVEIAYAYQELSELPEGVELPAGRTKPWGTGQAVLACKEVLHEPFAVINADDYYGKEAFVKTKIM